jgi:hypothetical protein
MCNPMLHKISVKFCSDDERQSPMGQVSNSTSLMAALPLPYSSAQSGCSRIRRGIARFYDTADGGGLDELRTGAEDGEDFHVRR